MCEFISFFHNPKTGDVVVYDLNSHVATEKKLKLPKAIWREGHYKPNGTIEARVAPGDTITADDCAEQIRHTWPTFCDFMSWAFGQDIVPLTTLRLDGLTSLPENLPPWPKSLTNLWLDGLTAGERDKIKRSIPNVR